MDESHEKHLHGNCKGKPPFKVPIWIFATTSKICTRGRFTQIVAKSFTKNPAPSCSSELRYLPWPLSTGTTLERHPFSGLVDWAGVFLHTPVRFPTSMTTVLLSRSTNTYEYKRTWKPIFASDFHGSSRAH